MRAPKRATVTRMRWVLPIAWAAVVGFTVSLPAFPAPNVATVVKPSTRTVGGISLISQELLLKSTNQNSVTNKPIVTKTATDLSSQVSRTLSPSLSSFASPTFVLTGPTINSALIAPAASKPPIVVPLPPSLYIPSSPQGSAAGDLAGVGPLGDGVNVCGSGGCVWMSLRYSSSPKASAGSDSSVAQATEPSEIVPGSQTAEGGKGGGAARGLGTSVAAAREPRGIVVGQSVADLADLGRGSATNGAAIDVFCGNFQVAGVAIGAEGAYGGISTGLGTSLKCGKQK